MRMPLRLRHVQNLRRLLKNVRRAEVFDASLGRNVPQGPRHFTSRNA
jgi:hypothetical protein